MRFFLKGKISLRLQYALWALVLVRLLVPFSIGEATISIGTGLAELVKVEEVQEFSEFMQTELSNRNYQESYEKVLKKYVEQGNDIETVSEDTLTEAIEYEMEDALKVEWSFAEIAIFIWGAGACIVSGIFIHTNRRFRKIVRECPQLCLEENSKKMVLYNCSKEKETQEKEIQEKRKDVSIHKNKLPIYVSNEIETPCLFGFFHPAIYITREVLLDETLLQHVIAHETTHYFHKDHIWGSLRALCLAIHWYNPLVWCAAVLSQNDAELACDEGVIQCLGEEERASYGRTLIHLTCERRPKLLQTATTMAESGKTIKERIVMLVKKPKTTVYTLIAVIFVVVAVIYFTFTGAKRSAGFEEWTRSLKIEDIQDATLSKGYGAESIGYDIPKREYGQLCAVLGTITEKNCSNREQTGDKLDGYKLYIIRDNKDWLFQCLDDGTIRLLFDDAEMAAYYGGEGTSLIIESPELWNYIMDTITEKGIPASEYAAGNVPQEEEYSVSKDGIPVTDEKIITDILALVENENHFITKIDTEWPDTQQKYEIDNREYLLVEEGTSWDDYEEQAGNYYSEVFVEENFSVWYTEHTKTFVEKDGKLYRAMSDGIGISLKSDTIQISQLKDAWYYVTIETESDVEGSMNCYLVRTAENKPYGFEIADKGSIN